MSFNFGETIIAEAWVWWTFFVYFSLDIKVIYPACASSMPITPVIFTAGSPTAVPPTYSASSFKVFSMGTLSKTIYSN